MVGKEWVHILVQAVRRILCEKSWVSCFAENGLDGTYVGLRKRIADTVQPFLPLPLRLPTEEEVACLIGRKRSDVAGLVFRASERLAGRPLLRMHMPLRKLPPAPRPRYESGVEKPSGSSGPLPPLPPPHGDPPAAADVPRLTRSGSRY